MWNSSAEFHSFGAPFYCRVRDRLESYAIQLEKNVYFPPHCKEGVQAPTKIRISLGRTAVILSVFVYLRPYPCVGFFSEALVLLCECIYRDREYLQHRQSYFCQYLLLVQGH